jgi:WD40 repeat protein
MRGHTILLIGFLSSGLGVTNAIFTTQIASSLEFGSAPVKTSNQSVPKEAVRAELIRLQSKEGLTLASFYRGIEIVNFSDRSRTQNKESFAPGKAEEKGVEGEGAISTDGSEIAFTLTRIGLSPPPFSRKLSLGIIHPDGSGFQEFQNVAAPIGICWSTDKSQLAMSLQVPASQDRPLHATLVTLNFYTKETQEIATVGVVTSQCWSPNGKQVVYEAEGRICVYDFNRKESQVLAKGKYPTWSTNGQWLAFLDDDTYYAIGPSGEGRKILFKKKAALSGVWWSPDSHIVAYVSRNGPFEGSWWKLMDVGVARLRVRRLDDSSEDWVAELADVYIPEYQWVASPELLKQLQHYPAAK